MTRLSIAISTCPNDTFAFAGLLAEAVDRRGLQLSIDLTDIDALNRRLAAGRGDVLKASFNAALRVADEVLVLPVGAALGYGVGPVVLAAEPWPAERVPRRVLAPGPQTTATLLFEALHPDLPRCEHVVFSDIVPALEAGRADWGVCIHEARFTWRERGLALVEDLGQRFEAETGAPLPLGGLIARRSLSLDALATLVAVVRDSLAWAAAHRESALEIMRAHALEHSDEVLWRHVELYVNDATRDLGWAGHRALEHFADWAARAGSVPRGTRLAVLQSDARTLASAAGPPPRVFHVADAAAWSAWEPSAGSWSPPSLAEQGFVHLSLAEQLEGTLRTHFAAAERLTLIELDAARLGLALRFEPSRGGALFPHLYRPIEAQDALREWPLTRSGARWSTPRIASEPEADVPPAAPARGR